MNKAAYDNPIRKQVMSLPDLVTVQLDKCFDEQKLQNLMSMLEIFDARSILITGCGDSYAAAGAMAPVLQKYCGVFHCDAIEAIDFTRLTEKADIGIGEPNSPFVIAISANGGTARIVEVLQKADELGAFPILITNNAVSRAAAAAKHMYCTDTPAMENDFPGLRSYFANLLSLISIACRMGHVRGILSPEAPEIWKAAICQYVESYRDALVRIDDQMFELAQKWKDFERFDFIGDGPGLCSALFSMEKFIECTGTACNYDDSEDWCHIDFFLKDPESVGTVVYADKNAPSFSRIVETVDSAVKINRPVLVITDADPACFPAGATVCTIPSTPAGFAWLAPVMDYAPASILAGYCCTLASRKFFNAYDPATNVYDRSGVFFADGVMTTGTSQIEIYQ